MTPVKLCVFLLVCGSISAQDDAQDFTVTVTGVEERDRLPDSIVEKLNNLETRLTNSETRITNSETRLTNSETRLNDYINKVHTTVAFSAALGGAIRAVGPFDTDTTLLFNNVITNIGNAYNAQTGIFTAPVGGVYYFTFFYHAQGSYKAGLFLYKSDERIIQASDHKSTADGADNGGNAAFVQLQAGDQVFVRMVPNTHVWANSYLTTFSGFLVSAI